MVWRVRIGLAGFKSPWFRLGCNCTLLPSRRTRLAFIKSAAARVSGYAIRRCLASAAESDSEVAGPAVGKDEIVKGYEYRKGEYILIEPSELENLKVPSKHTIDVSQFVTMDELRPEYVEKPYFVVPENDSQAEAFAVVRKALQKSGKVAIGKVSFAGRENIIAVRPAGDDAHGGMIAYTLRYSNELRNEQDYFRDLKAVEINEESLELAEALIAKKSSKLDLSKFEDGYEVAVKELIEAKVNKMPVPKDEAPNREGRSSILWMRCERALGGRTVAPASAFQRSPWRARRPIRRRELGW